MSECRSFYAPGVDPNELARTVSNWLTLHDFQSRTEDLPPGVTIQARQPETWKSFLGMSSALNITFCTRGHNLEVTTEAGRWADKIAVGAVGAFILHPLLITAAYGVWKQSQLPDRIFDVVEQFIKDRQKSAKSAPTRVQVKSTDESSSDKAGASAGIDSKPASDEKQNACAKCGAPVTPGAKFCQECGARLAPEPVKIN